MSEPVLYIRGFPPFGSQPIGDPVIDDLCIVGNIVENQLERLCESLEKVKGFLDPSRISSLITKEILDSKQARAVFRVLVNIKPDTLDEFIEHVDEWRTENQGKVSEEIYQNIKKTLKRIVRPYGALERFRKAEHLEKATGQALEDVQLICDLRPIFDESRENIEGVIPYTRLRIVAEGADGLPVATEVELTQQQVQELAEKAQNALKKLRTMKQQTEKWLPGGIPELSRTWSSDRENDNE